MFMQITLSKQHKAGWKMLRSGLKLKNDVEKLDLMCISSPDDLNSFNFPTVSTCVCINEKG
jgi:hypothetical protein